MKIKEEVNVKLDLSSCNVLAWQREMAKSKARESKKEKKESERMQREREREKAKREREKRERRERESKEERVRAHDPGGERQSKQRDQFRLWQ
jgi:hypothetical protein